jgi:hypothetical protein
MVSEKAKFSEKMSGVLAVPQQARRFAHRFSRKTLKL